MLKKHAHFGDSKAAKVDFVITIESLELINVMQYPEHMKVEWARSSHSGKTTKAQVDDTGRATWNQVIDFTSKMYMDKKGLAPKSISFTVKYVKADGKSKQIGKLSLNLSDFVDFDRARESHSTRVSRLIAKDEKMKLNVSFKCTIVKLKLKNNKKLAVNKETGQWEEGADSEWSASEMDPDPGERSSGGGSRSSRGKGRKKDDSSSDDESDSLTDAIESYNASILEDNAAKRGKAFGSGSGGFPRDHHIDRDRDRDRNRDRDKGRDRDRSSSPRGGKNYDPFAAHNEDFLRRNRDRDDGKDGGRSQKGKSKHSDSDDKEPDGEEEEDDDCKCVVS